MPDSLGDGKAVLNSAPLEAPVSPVRVPEAVGLEANCSALVDAAGISGGLWVSYIFALFYLLVAVAGVTHRDLFFASPIKLPFLNVELPLKGFFWLGPAIFLVVHAYVLLHFVLLASKASALDAQIARVDDAEAQTRLRRQLPINIFVQFLSGPDEVRRGAIGFLLRHIAWISLMLAPLALLVFFELQFLPYHDVAISWWQRIAVVIDLVLLWATYPKIFHGEAARRGWRHIGWHSCLRLTFISLVSISLVFAIATFPGEWLETKLSWFPLRQLLVDGGTDLVTRKPKALWPNRLVIVGLDVIDHTKFDDLSKIAAATNTVSLRGRNFDGADLFEADLRKVDFYAASFKGADLIGAQLQGAVLEDAKLQGADLFQAALQGTNLFNAHLQGAFMSYAKLQGADLAQAQLEAADLTGARLEAADLSAAQLQGALLDRAQLQGADLGFAELQGASLDGAQLQVASLFRAFVWRANLTNANAEGSEVMSVAVGPVIGCKDKLGEACDWANTLDGLKQLIEREVPEGDDRKKKSLDRLELKLNPKKPLDGEDKMALRWADLQHASPARDVYDERVAKLWGDIGCAPDGAPFVLAALANRLTYAGNPFHDPNSPQVPKVASAFLKKDCAGARGMSQNTWTTLVELRDAASRDR